ncbi:MAG TPA: RluA family pseudouridine synthase [Vulgatibacter sp.]|nr:RluA family pseudouridine synthase [Vulgatibacter sp.]
MPAETNHGYAHREVVGAAAAGRTVLAWLATTYVHSDAATWRERIEGGEVEVDGRPALPDQALRAGQVLVWNRPPWSEPEVPLHYDLLHVDDQVLAVAKPSGLPTMAAGGFLQNTLHALVDRDHPGANPVHRLGRGTSGVVIFARSPEAASKLARGFRERRVRKVYLALATGDPAWESKSIEVPIGPVAHARLGTVHAATQAGKRARTQARVLERRGDACLLEVGIETGRPHQIRIHLAAAEHPLLGDPLYQPGGHPRQHVLPGDLGYHLHAWRVEFEHPAGGRMEIKAPPPPPLKPKSRSGGPASVAREVTSG